MNIKGIDTIATITKDSAVKLKAEGYSFVGRYLVPWKMDKAVSFTEAKTIRDAGLAVLLLFEISASRAKQGANIGATDGATAKQIAQEMGSPTATTIYFCVDYDAPKSDYQAIEQYIVAAKYACSPYRCGVYGKKDLIDSVKADAYMQCVAWSNGVSSKADIYQYQWQGGPEAEALKQKLGFAVDLNKCNDMRKAGMWMPDTESHWYDEPMAYVKDRGILNDGRPNDPITRAEVATVIMRVIKYVLKILGKEGADK